jgi:hypothetical protein
MNFLARCIIVKVWLQALSLRLVALVTQENVTGKEL